MIKWFFVIFFAVFFAIVSAYFAVIGLTYWGAVSFLQNVKIHSPTNTHRPTIRFANPIMPGQTSVQIQCDSWKSLYKNDPKTPYLMQMQEACKKAYGPDWVYENDR